ncbi:membrane protein YfhO [Streptomyces sp. Ag109_G2-6]|uniref:YfhO family protein n=1 Tax=Streptomyces TaxID=1883 RepID=UPI0009A4908F|nr:MULTISPECIES: YfhO family protein [Streptomyces]RPF39991.1 membrane protein YfhO [Streptomyces sp. Ag109_G2-6]
MSVIVKSPDDPVTTLEPALPGSVPRAAALGAGVAMSAYCLAMAVHGTYPFGSRSRAVNDLGNQFVPFHAHLWDLLHGNTSGDLVFNWNSGYGVPFLADLFAYLMNPFSWLVWIFPRAMVELPVFLVTLLSIGLGTSLMAVFLVRLRPGPAWPAALLAVGYGVSSWTTGSGWADPMWMWGLVSFPLMGIAGDWCLKRRRWVAGVLVVALCWTANFYTAAMATLGMGLVFAVRLALDPRPTRERGRSALRALSMATVGVLIAAPVLTVSLAASRAAQPVPAVPYAGAPSVRAYLAHLLPGGYHAGAPQVAVGSLALLLVLVFPFVGRAPRRERAVWCVLAAAVALSLVWKPTMLVWHGGAMPNGGPYRASIALTAILVAIAWLALTYQPRPRELLAGAAVLALLPALAGGDPYVSRRTWAMTVTGGAVTLALLWLLPRATGVRGRTVAAALTATVFLGAAGSTWSVTVIRDTIDWWQPKRTLDAQSLAAYEAVRAQDAWPATRSDPGPHEFADNDPLLLGGEGGSYYSSYVPARTAETLSGLGAGWHIAGRHLLSFDDPVGQALMGVGARLDPASGTRREFTQRTGPAPPVVTLRARGTRLDAESGGDASVFHLRNRVLSAPVYTVPEPRPARGAPVLRLPAGEPTTLMVRCPADTVAYFHAPWYSGTVTALGTTTTVRARAPMTRAGLVPLGHVTSGRDFPLVLTPEAAQPVPRSPLGCLDTTRLERAVNDMSANAPARVNAGGHAITAVFDGPRTGAAVVSAPAVEGWQCSVDGGDPQPPSTLGGLIAVRMTGHTRVACSYRTPGLHAGVVLSACALAVLLGVAAIGSLRRRPQRPPHCQYNSG